MFEDMGNMEASCVCDVKVGTLNQLEQSKICVLNVISFRIVIPAALHHFIVSVCIV